MKNIKYFCIIPIFIVLYVLYHTAGLFDNSLNKLDVVSIATFENYSIDALIWFSYLFIGGFILGISLLTLFFKWLYKQSSIFQYTAPYLNAFSAIGILLLFCVYTRNAGIAEVNSIFLLSFAYILFSLNPSRKKAYFWWLCILTLSLSIMVKDVYLLCHSTKIPDIGIIWFVTFSLLLVGNFIFQKFSLKTKNILYACRPLFFLPWLSILSDEIYLIFNQRGFSLLSPDKLYVLGLMLILCISGFLYFRKNICKSIINELYYSSFPVMLSGLAAFTFYRAFINQPDELFELANPANALANIFVHHQVPFVDYLNSHALSELFFKFIYIGFNGYSGTVDFLLYDFLFTVICTLICYYFFLRIFGKCPVVFFLVLFCPFTSILVPSTIAPTLILLYLLYRLFERYSFKKLLGVTIFTIFIGVWQFDVGLPCLFISLIFLTIYLIYHFSRKYLLDYLKVVGIICGIMGLLAMVFYLRDSQLFVGNFKQALGYLSANQAHAHPSVLSPDFRINTTHYVLFPILIGIIVLLVLYLKKTQAISKRNWFIGFSILFLALFYFFNFQRGLVRHSMAEGMDSFLMRFSYLTIALFAIFVLPQKYYHYRPYVFFATATLLIYCFKFPEPQEEWSLYNQFRFKYKKVENLEVLPVKTPRVLNTKTFAEENYKDIQSFMNQYFDSSATFIDFSNTPMLYFYTQRKVPSYFCQYMQNTVTEKLQEENLKLLRTLNIPVVVFSNFPQTWFDCTDGVPNTLRYRKITQFIYHNYKPYTILNHHTIWLRKDLHLQIPDSTSKDFAYITQYHDLKKYPYLLGRYGEIKIEKNHLNIIKSNEGVPVSFTLTNKEVFCLIDMPPLNELAALKLNYYYQGKEMGSYQFETIPSHQREAYVIPVNYQYNWYCGLIDSLNIIADKNMSGRIKFKLINK